jgi:ABC-type multidrug transport system permease subunit
MMNHVDDQPPRQPWWQTATSVGQAVGNISALILLSIGIILGGTRSGLNPLLWVAFVVLSGVLIGSGIATIVTLRRHPEMQHATRQRRHLTPAARRRYVIATSVTGVLTAAAFVVAGLIQTPTAWSVCGVAAIATFVCFLQVGRPLTEANAPTA